MHGRGMKGNARTVKGLFINNKHERGRKCEKKCRNSKGTIH